MIASFAKFTAPPEALHILDLDGPTLPPKLAQLLSLKDQKIFGFVQRFIETNGFSPTQGEIAEGSGGFCKSTIIDSLDHLESWGLIERQRGKQRSIKLIEQVNKADDYRQALADVLAVIHDLRSNIPERREIAQEVISRAQKLLDKSKRPSKKL